MHAFPNFNFKLNFARGSSFNNLFLINSGRGKPSTSSSEVGQVLPSQTFSISDEGPSASSGLTGSGPFIAEIIWNCIGWQSVIVLFLTFLTGLSGSHSRVSKLQVVLAGILGTFLVNIARITLVAFSIILVPQIPAEVLHNYLSTFITISWLFFFWWFSYSFVLEEKANLLGS